ncbi:MAG: c-type cytochrome [Alphaproteobacteria bacterium]|nr:c-type cytochrome [Alphaproteobacteria bacterium]
MPRYVAAVGCIILLLPATASADATHGQQVFQRCAACHSIAASASAMLGPNLKGVIGRRAGTLPGFEYSSAMVDAGKSDNIVWTRDVLDKYLTDPDDVVPGTAMRLGFQLTAGERRDVIDYLEQAGKQ